MRGRWPSCQAVVVGTQTTKKATGVVVGEQVRQIGSIGAYLTVEGVRKSTQVVILWLSDDSTLTIPATAFVEYRAAQ